MGPLFGVPVEHIFMMHYEISAEEAARRLSCGNGNGGTGNGRKERSRNLQPAERVEIGIEAKFRKAAEVAEEWGISPSTVYQISGGFIQTSEQRENGGAGENARDIGLVEGISEGIEKTKTKIISTATSKLLKAMNGITDEKLSEAKIRVLSAIAKDMAIIVEKTEGKGGGGVGGVIVNIHPPDVMHIDNIPVINVVPEKR